MITVLSRQYTPPPPFFFLSFFFYSNLGMNSRGGLMIYCHKYAPLPLQLRIQVEEDRAFDAFTIPVWKDGAIVGHIPQKLTKISWYFLHKQHSTMTYRVTIV